MSPLVFLYTGVFVSTGVENVATSEGQSSDQTEAADEDGKEEVEAGEVGGRRGGGLMCVYGCGRYGGTVGARWGCASTDAL